MQGQQAAVRCQGQRAASSGLVRLPDRLLRGRATLEDDHGVGQVDAFLLLQRAQPGAHLVGGVGGVEVGAGRIVDFGLQRFASRG
jgi:hypothetical protein